MGLEECHNKSCQTCAETFCGDCSRCLSERTGGSCSAEGSAMGVEKIIRDIQVGSYHAHCFNDVQLREILTKALISHGDAMYLAGALAHQEATRVEKMTLPSIKWKDEIEEKVIGRKVLKIFISEEYLKFETDKGDVCFTVEGGRCSRSYFHDFVGVEKLLKNGQIKSFKEIDDIPKELEYDEKKPDGEYDDCVVKAYGYAIVTEDPQFGDVTSVIAFRKSSNGYYGGSLEFCETVQCEMVEITSDWSTN